MVKSYLFPMGFSSMVADLVEHLSTWNKVHVVIPTLNNVTIRKLYSLNFLINY